tara:strand:+ start:3838 stop:4596 length:759 start_codon:yes stop_codon:yes gene_type:complete
MKLKIDNRERKFIDLIKIVNPCFSIEYSNLVLGDFIICDNEGYELIVIERKTLNDLVASIKDGRYKEQSFRLNNYPVHNHNIIYLIEGINKSNFNSQEKKMIESSYFSLMYYKGFSVIRTKNIEETFKFVIRIMNKIKKEKKRIVYYKNNEIANENNNNSYVENIKCIKKKNIVPENIGAIILNQIPGISNSTSLILMKKFGSIYNLIKQIENDKERNILKNIKYITSSGKERRISKKSIENIYNYLLYKNE